MHNRLDASHQWKSSGDIEVFRKPGEDIDARKYLVFMSASESVDFQHDFLLEAGRGFDLAVRYYFQPDPHDPLLTSADYALTGGLSKFHAAQQFLINEDLLDRYDAYMFMDGDIDFAAGDLDRLLLTSTAMGFDLSQAALTDNSHTSWHVTKASTKFICRETSFVEVMAPCFSRQALKKVIDTFGESISSYGIDFAWGRILEEHKIGIIDTVRMRHANPIDLLHGSFYTYLRSIQVDPRAEQRLMFERYGISPLERPHDKAGYLLKDKERRTTLTRVPLARLPRAFASRMRWQDSPAIQLAKLLRKDATVSLRHELP